MQKPERVYGAMKRLIYIVGVLFVCSVGSSLRANVIIDLTYIGNAGNADDLMWEGNPDVPEDDIYMGGVSYDYYIGTYEVTVAQYTEFLNAVAASDPYGLYNSSMATGPLGATILQSGTDGSYTYSATAGTENQPVGWVSVYDGIRLCNWMSNGQGSGDTEKGSYTLSDGEGVSRTANATWVLPSEDEWYKAAYYDPDTDSYYTYPNGSDEVPAEPTDETTTREMNFGDDPYWQGTICFTQIGQTTGSSPYGVYDMGGNVQEYTDTLSSPGINRVARGGELCDHETALRNTSCQPYDPTTEGDLLGLRLAYIIPEPTTFILFSFGIPFLLRLRRRWD